MKAISKCLDRFCYHHPKLGIPQLMKYIALGNVFVQRLVNTFGRAAMNAFNRELLSDHIRTCVAHDIREGNDETIDELLKTLQK